MSGSHLLDTNIIVAVFKSDSQVIARLAVTTGVVAPVVAIGELQYGAYHSAKVEQNLAQVRAFADTIEVLPCDAETADYYGRIKHDLRTTGNPIPENDIWIAAVALQHNLILVSRDQHFRHISNLKWEQW
ncbi:type II toxin-antitoxin system VapC family toxin [Anatilimnocola floriformis]|uniref:type II toxin-antitoxin system VapC family toxin n=1 Tax=Anatilimnocola floriformis TaxID=2948575 RepID=UPI0020C4A6E2|nr:type II toxin-antitoxin system VapC family toxin [Anatilimnocola floriformis]